MVYVESQEGEPLMPCKNVIARLLLKENRAKVKRKTPFTIKLKHETTNYTQELTLGIDTGSSKVGSAVYNNENGDVIYVSEIEIRNDVSKRMEKRAKYRRARRNRKTRYRKPRFDNRKNSTRKDRFPPTMVSKINSHLKEIRFVKSILPIKNIVLETGNFDPHKLKNPDVKSWGYQKGILYGYSNKREFALKRDNYKCQHCKGKSKDSKLEVHHIVFRSNDGSDEPENLITLCKTCHDKLHDGKIKLKGGRAKKRLKHATQMNSIRTQLLKLIPEAIETFGYITKENRWSLGLLKTHYSDAITIACCGLPIRNTISKILFKKCINIGDYQQTKGVRSQKKIPTGKIQGIRKFDKVRYLGNEYFVKGRMSSGYCILMDIQGNKVKFNNAPRGMKTPKMSHCRRMQARDSWIMIENHIVSA
ncbi:MAG: RNA-guided endonuclease IscB [Bacillota bacterium]|nr:RNA-guided endonuclease IscB [Bacillota bacterium]